MSSDILFLDKDNTLGQFGYNGTGLFVGARAFLAAQKQLGRGLYIATTGDTFGRKKLSEIDDLLDGYFGREQIDVVHRGQLYLLPDGAIRKVEDDFIERKRFESPEKRAALDRESRKRGDRLNTLPYDSPERAALQEEINAFFDYWRELLHKQTQESFDPSLEYKNPYCRGSFKDLHLARRIISPTDYTLQRTLMVGDPGDAGGFISDPETPLVVVSPRVREGEWDLVTRVVNHLFNDQERKPWELFDELYSQRKNVKKNPRKVRLSNETYEMKINEHKGRLIYCP
ncbi:MAG: hypothetical protein WCV90_08655 [Candidatus Woesearchaeota archaeon]